MNTTLTVNHNNWRTHEDFLHFLRFDFSLADTTPAVRHQVLTLIPLAVSEERLVGAIKETVLKAAIEAFNTPPLIHVFRREKDRWRYITAFPVTHQFEHLYNTFTFRKGRLKRKLSEGSYCRSPSLEVMAMA